MCSSDLFNVTNNQDPYYLYDNYQYYIDSQNRYIIAYRQDKISAELGVKYEF